MRRVRRPVRVAMRCEVVSAARTGGPDADCLPPRRAYTVASVVVDRDGVAARFVSASGVRFAAEAVATCPAGGRHAIPDPACRCGFSAASLENLVTTAGPPVLRPGRASAVLEVELGGRELEGPRGYRAAQQRVLATAFVPVCSSCAADEARLVRAVALGGFPPVRRTADWLVAPVCGAHGRALGSAQVWSLATVTGLLGAEVTWAGPELVGALFPEAGRLEPAAGSAVPVAELARGQVGYVEHTAVEVSADGGVWVDGTALAPSRSRTRDRIPVRRMADLRFEVWIRTLGVHGRIPSPSPLSNAPGPHLIPVAAVHADCGCSPHVPCEPGAV